MATIKVQNQSGKKVSDIELADAVFAAPVKEHLLWECVVAQRAGRRRGTASTKGRSQVRGSTRKVYRQKGTGNARHGSIRAPIYVGGGAAHGPKPRSYNVSLPKKVRRGALISALSLRHQENKLVVIDDLTLKEIKTKRMAEMLGKIGQQESLIVDDKANETLVKSVRNLPRAKYIAPEGLNVYDLLRYPTLILSADAAKQVEKRLLSNA